MGTENNHYPEFEYSATELSAYAFSVGTYIISLKGGKMTSFEPKDIAAFRSWLNVHRVRDISVDDGVTKYIRPDLPLKKNKGK
ncbi:MAG: hypothetical protein SFW35_05140 [Chitinophagales bacterium]|nr:hypothetical protein [Chitinophagales bacterium]